MRILWLKTELLHPVNKGGRIRTYNMLRHLKTDHDITYLTLDDGGGGRAAVERASEYADDLIRVTHGVASKPSLRFYGELVTNLFSPLPYFLQRYRSEAMRRTLTRLLDPRQLDVVVADFLVSGVNLPEDLEVPSVLFQHNVEAEIWRRHHEVAENPLKRYYFRQQWTRARDVEARICRRFDRVVAVSERDRETLRKDYGLDHVHAVDTGVDTGYFRPAGRRQPGEDQLVFVGSMDWLPNQDAMVWFVGEILPRIRDEIADTTLSIVGRHPSSAVRKLGREAGVTVTGEVPDIRPYLEEASVVVVPLRIGGGTRLKIYEAMAMERPVVSTSVGMEGLPLEHGEELLVADGADAFAAEVVKLLRAREEAEEMGRRAAERVRKDFGWNRVAADFAEICREANREHGSRGGERAPSEPRTARSSTDDAGWRAGR